MPAVLLDQVIQRMTADLNAALAAHNLPTVKLSYTSYGKHKNEAIGEIPLRVPVRKLALSSFLQVLKALDEANKVVGALDETRFVDLVRAWQTYEMFAESFKGTHNGPVMKRYYNFLQECGTTPAQLLDADKYARLLWENIQVPIMEGQLGVARERLMWLISGCNHQIESAPGAREKRIDQFIALMTLKADLGFKSKEDKDVYIGRLWLDRINAACANLAARKRVLVIEQQIHAQNVRRGHAGFAECAAFAQALELELSGKADVAMLHESGSAYARAAQATIGMGYDLNERPDGLEGHTVAAIMWNGIKKDLSIGNLDGAFRKRTHAAEAHAWHRRFDRALSTLEDIRLEIEKCGKLLPHAMIRLLCCEMEILSSMGRSEERLANEKLEVAKTTVRTQLRIKATEELYMQWGRYTRSPQLVLTRVQ